MQPLTGANNLTQYNALIGYTPLAEPQSDTIKLEIALREPLLLDTVNGSVRTILRNPISTNSLIAPVAINCISRLEAFAEKRAALTRRQVAVRDFLTLITRYNGLG